MTEERVPQVGDVFIDGWADEDGERVAVMLCSWAPEYPKFEKHLGKRGSVSIELAGRRYDVSDLRRGEIGPNGTVIR